SSPPETKNRLPSGAKARPSQDFLTLTVCALAPRRRSITLIVWSPLPLVVTSMYWPSLLKTILSGRSLVGTCAPSGVSVQPFGSSVPAAVLPGALRGRLFAFDCATAELN